MKIIKSCLFYNRFRYNEPQFYQYFLINQLIKEKYVLNSIVNIVN